VLAVALALGWVRIRTEASDADFGFVPEKFLADVRLGLLAFLASVAPVYGLQVALKTWLPDDPIVDPVSLFVFALVLGTLYYRTHRIVPAIVAHMALNAFSLLMLWVWLEAAPIRA
jgi:hypothetical protein